MSLCRKYDPGQWVREHTNVFLVDTLPDGKRVLSYRKATPAAMQEAIAQLEELTATVGDELQRVYDRHGGSPEWRRISSEYNAWVERLNQYGGLVDVAAAGDDRMKPGSIYHCVTAPLLLGWYPNAECTGPDPSQKQQRTPDVSMAMSLYNQLSCLAESELSAPGDAVTLYWTSVRDGLAELGSDITDAATRAADGVRDSVKAINEVSILKVGVLAGIGLAIYLVLTK